MEYYKNLSLELLTGYDDDGNFHVEEFKDIPNFEGLYQASTFGRVKRLPRLDSNNHSLKEIIRRPYFTDKGYLSVTIHKNKKTYRFLVHRIVAVINIPNPENKPEVNHIDRIKINCCVWNLEWNTSRENLTHHFLCQKTASKYTGVCWVSHISKWKCAIRFNGLKVHLGYFKEEIDASNAYQKALKEINEGTFVKPIINKTSQYVGVSYCKERDSWVAAVTFMGKTFRLGRFKDEITAHEACEKKRKELRLL